MRRSKGLLGWLMETNMSHKQQRFGRRPRREAVPSMTAAGLSLSLSGGAPPATAAVMADMPSRNAAVGRKLTVAEEEICDVSLATFYLFNRENSRPPRRHLRLTAGYGGCGCGGCGCGPPWPR